MCLNKASEMFQNNYKSSVQLFEWNINNQEFDYHPKHADMKLSPIVRSCYFLILCATSDKAFEVVKGTSTEYGDCLICVLICYVLGRSMELCDGVCMPFGHLLVTYLGLSITSSGCLLLIGRL